MNSFHNLNLESWDIQHSYGTIIHFIQYYSQFENSFGTFVSMFLTDIGLFFFFFCCKFGSDFMITS